MYITRKETESSDREQEGDEAGNEGITFAPVDALPFAYLAVEASKSEVVVEALSWAWTLLTSIG
jgi:hypothetical protein